MTPEQSKALREPFAPHLVGVLPKPTKKDNPKGQCKEPRCNGYHGLPAVHLDYVGHATVTDRLLEVDPEWTWEPVAFDDKGAPLLDRVDGKPVGLWLRLTVAGVTRLGYGSVEGAAFDPVKQLISDGIRNAAMRFGVALALWSKEEFEAPAEKPARPRKPADDEKPPPRTDAPLSEVHEKCKAFFRDNGWSAENARAEMESRYNKLAVGALTVEEAADLLAHLEALTDDKASA